MMLKNKFSEQILLQTKNCLPRAYRFYKLSRIITAGYAYRDVEADWGSDISKVIIKQIGNIQGIIITFTISYQIAASSRYELFSKDFLDYQDYNL